MQVPSLLLITPRFPFPMIGGDKVRIGLMAQQLARNFEVTLLSLCESKEEMSAEVPDGLFSRVERYYLPRWRSVLQAAIALPTSVPLQNAYYRSKAFDRRVRQLSEEHDVILAHLIRAGQYIENIDHPIKILEMTDAISLNYTRIKSKTKKVGFKERVFSIEAKRLREYELKTASKFSHISLISRVDADWISNGDIGVYTCAFNFDKSLFEYDRDGSDIIFIGNMHTVQNMDAAMYFAKEVLPLVRQAYPLTFKVIGAGPSENLEKLAALPGVAVTGRVASVAEAAKSGICGVCMLRTGAGVQTKILEYMALGLPAVVNSMALEGLEARPGADVLLADAPRDAAGAIIRLSREKAECRRLAEAGARYLQAVHTPEIVLRPLIAKINLLLSEERTGRQ